MTSGSEGGRPHRLVVPDERPEVRRTRWRRRLLVAAALAAVAAGAYHVWGDTVVDRLASSSVAARGLELLRDGRAGAVADTASVDAPPSVASGAGGGSDTAAMDPAVRNYRATVGELRQAIRRFMERSSDYRLERIGCPELARGYAVMDRATVDLARIYVDVRARLGPADERDFDRAMARADSASRAFDDTGCERVF